MARASKTATQINANDLPIDVILQGDSIEELSKLPDECIDVIFADPPYFLSNGGVTVNSQASVSRHELPLAALCCERTWVPGLPRTSTAASAPWHRRHRYVPNASE